MEWKSAAERQESSHAWDLLLASAQTLSTRHSLDSCHMRLTDLEILLSQVNDRKHRKH